MVCDEENLKNIVLDLWIVLNFDRTPLLIYTINPSFYDIAFKILKPTKELLESRNFAFFRKYFRELLFTGFTGFIRLID